MTTEADPAVRRRHLGRWLLVAAALVVVIAAACLIDWSGRYDPLRPGGRSMSFIGPAPGMSERLSMDPSGSQRIVGGPGTEVTLQSAVSNTGPVGVTIDGIVPGWSIVSGSWSEYRTVPGGPVNGEPAPEHAFPAKFPAHRTFRLTFTVRQPDCATGTHADFLGAVWVRWHALGQHHVSYLAVGEAAGADPYLTFCDPH